MLHDKKLNYSQRYNKKKYSNKPVCCEWKMKRKSSWTAAWTSGHYVLRGKIEPLFKPTRFWHSIIMYLLFNFIKFLVFLIVFFWYFNERVLQSIFITMQSLQAEFQLVLHRTSTELSLENSIAIYLCSLLASYFISHLWY